MEQIHGDSSQNDARKSPHMEEFMVKHHGERNGHDHSQAHDGIYNTDRNACPQGHDYSQEPEDRTSTDERARDQYTPRKRRHVNWARGGKAETCSDTATDQV